MQSENQWRHHQPCRQKPIAPAGKIFRLPCGDGDCACIVRASCLLPAAGTRGVRDAGENERTPPPRRALVPRGNSGERGSQEGKSKGKGAGPPPQTSARPRAHILPATCMPRRKGLHERPASAPAPPPTAAPRKETANQHGAGRPPQRVLGRGRGRQGGGNQGQAKSGGGGTGVNTGPASVTCNKQGGRKAGMRNPILNPALQLSCIVPVRGRAYGESEGQAGHGGSPGAQKRSAGRGKNEGRERKGRGQHSRRGGSGTREPTGAQAS